MEKSYVGMARCFYCLEPSQILLDRRLRASLPHDCGIVNMEPCAKCKEWMEKGVILIAVNPDSMGEVNVAHSRRKLGDRKRPFIPNPYRTGGWFVLKDAVITRIVRPPELAKQMIEFRWSFIGEDAARMLGLYDNGHPRA